MTELRGTCTAYLLHFDRPYKHARHYIGVTRGDVNRRIEEHEKGNGANLVRIITKAGITWRIARVWENVARRFELSLKARGGASRLCPICRAEGLYKGRNRAVKSARKGGRNTSSGDAAGTTNTAGTVLPPSEPGERNASA